MNIVIWLSILIGFCWWMVALINRLHSFPLKCHDIRKINRPLFLFSASGPFVLLLIPGLLFPGLLLGGDFFSLPFPVQCVWSVIALGCLGLYLQWMTSCYNWLIQRQIPTRSHVIDLKQEVGESIFGQGHYLKIAKLKFNEVSSVEVNEKQLTVPGWPAHLDGFRVLHLTDFHIDGTLTPDYFNAALDKLDNFPKPDLSLFTGDLIDDPRYLDWIPKIMNRGDARLGRYYLLGNHDWNLDVEPLRETMESLGWIPMAGQVLTVSDGPKKITLCGSEKPWMGNYPNANEFPSDAPVLLASHSPDDIQWAKKHGVDLVLAGHNHGGQIRFPGFGPLLAPSWYGTRYASGVYFSKSTVMHVGRGLSGRHPLRWNCRPEISHLVIRASHASRHIAQSSQQLEQSGVLQTPNAATARVCAPEE